MNKFGVSVFTGAVLLVASAMQSQAGGVYEVEGSMKDPVSDAIAVPAPMPIPDTTAWYIRGDVGYSAFQDMDGVEGGQYALTGLDIDGGYSVGGGIGYYFTPSLRGDITVDYLAESEITGINNNAAAPVGGGTREFGFRSTAVLLNAYYDFNRFGRLSPYVGVGVGAAFNSTSSGDATGAAYTAGTSGSIRPGSSTSFAYALMAGATYKISDGLYLDGSYRYLNIGDLSTGSLDDLTENDPAITIAPAVRAANNGGSTTIDDVDVHQVRIGIRQDIW